MTNCPYNWTVKLAPVTFGHNTTKGRCCIVPFLLQNLLFIPIPLKFDEINLREELRIAFWNINHMNILIWLSKSFCNNDKLYYGITVKQIKKQIPCNFVDEQVYRGSPNLCKKFHAVLHGVHVEASYLMSCLTSYSVTVFLFYFNISVVLLLQQNKVKWRSADDYVRDAESSYQNPAAIEPRYIVADY